MVIWIHLKICFTLLGILSGCKINVSKSEAIHIGRLKGSAFKPFNNEGLV